MMKIYYPIIVTLLCIFLLNMANAEIVTDGSVGAVNTLSADAQNNYQIDASLGTQNGGNLFHSFTSFNVETGHSANFTGSSTVSNIIARVTGTGGSLIEGNLNSQIAGANLWLINKNGITFGDNATVNIDGAFYASTADSLTFTDGTFFNSDGSSVLSAAEPAAFGFISETSSISAGDAQVTVADGTSASFVASQISLRNTVVDAREGSINLVSVGANGGDVYVLGNDLDASSLTSLGTIDFHKAALNVSGDRQGRVVLKANNIEIDTNESDYIISFVSVAPDLLAQGDVLNKPCEAPVFGGQEKLSFFANTLGGNRS